MRKSQTGTAQICHLSVIHSRSQPPTDRLLCLCLALCPVCGWVGGYEVTWRALGVCNMPIVVMPEVKNTPSIKCLKSLYFLIVCFFEFSDTEQQSLAADVLLGLIHFPVIKCKHVKIGCSPRIIWLEFDLKNSNLGSMFWSSPPQQTTELQSSTATWI